MSLNDIAQVQVEVTSTPYAMELIPDSGDHTVYNTQAVLLSANGAASTDIKPNGVLTGINVIMPVSGSNNVVDVEAGTVNLLGIKTVITSAQDLPIARPASDVASIHVVTVDNAGALVVIPGTDSVDNNFSETYGAAGGPPLIPVDSIALAQVRIANNTSQPIIVTELFSTVGTHRETSAFPLFSADNYSGNIIADVALPLVHVGSVTKRLYASYADPVFTEQMDADDFVPAANSHSVTSNQRYNSVKATKSTSLNQGSFTATLNNGISDPILALEDKFIFVKFHQDRSKPEHILMQGYLGIAQTFPSADNPQGTFTVSATTKALRVS